MAAATEKWGFTALTVKKTPPKRGTLLELHSLASARHYNGKVVLFDQVQDDKWVVTLFEENRSLKVLPRFARRPLALMDENERTDAPTLEELPPERYTVLELFDIGEGYDGTIVEFVKVDEATGKYFVKKISGGETVEEGMRVKPKCCRRPKIRSMEARRFLMDHAIKLHYMDLSKLSLLESRARALLQEYPSCAPAYFVLGRSLNLRLVSLVDLPPLENYRLSLNWCRSQRRGLASMYAHQDVFDPEYLRFEVSATADSLLTFGKNRAAIQTFQLLDSIQWSDHIEEAKAGLCFVRVLLGAAWAYHSRKLFAKELQVCVRASEIVCKIGKRLSETELESTRTPDIRYATVAPSAEEAQNELKTTSDYAKLILALFEPVHEMLMQEQRSRGNVDDRGGVQRTPEMRALWKTAQRTVDKLSESLLVTRTGKWKITDHDFEVYILAVSKKAKDELEYSEKSKEVGK